MTRASLAFGFLLLLAAATRAQLPPASTTRPAEASASAAPAADATPTPTPATPAAAVARPAAAGGTSPGGAAVVLPPEKANSVRVPLLKTAPVIDGALDGVWSEAAVLKDFYQIQPGDNIPASKPVEVMMGYDAKFLYLAFRAYDEPGKVRATIARRDAIFSDDFVGVYLDTFNDKRRAYALFFNPLGVQADAVLTEGRGEDYTVDIVMESKGALTPDGYVVEVAIPFKSLRYEAGKGKLWGVHAFRRIQRLDAELDSWMPFSRDNSGSLNQEGHLTGFEAIAEQRPLEFIPSVTLSETGRRVRAFPRGSALSFSDPGRVVNPALSFDPGLTAKIGLTRTTTLDLTVNPDFAQVEADQPVVTANQRFPIFFDEKRPFFLENIEVFRTPLTVVHTRAIIDPDYAFKLSGKEGRNSFGVILASDNAPGNFSDDERTDPRVLPGIARFLDKNAYIGVLRLKRDVGRESTLGMVATSYGFIERHNHTLGFDGRLRFNRTTVLDFQLVGTTSRRFYFIPDEGRNVYRTGNAFGYYVNLNRTGRNFGYNLSGEGRTRFYRAEVGFTQRVNTNRERLQLTYTSTPKPKARLISYRLSNSDNFFFDWQGRSQSWNNESRFVVNLQRQTSLTFGASKGYERDFEEEFGAKRTPTRRGAFAGDDPERSANIKTLFLIAGTAPSKQFSGSLFVARTWGQMDFDFGAGRRYPRVSPGALADPNAPLDPGPGDAWSVTSSLAYQPTDALRTTLDYTKSRLVRHDTGRVSFDDNIFTLRTTYQFTRFTFARARFDYSTLASRVRPQFLFGWAPNPGTAFYAGYNDDLNFNGFNPFTGQLEPGFRRNGRVFFLKASYLIRRTW
jgi:hypothetical protein